MPGSGETVESVTWTEEFDTEKVLVMSFGVELASAMIRFVKLSGETPEAAPLNVIVNRRNESSCPVSSSDVVLNEDSKTDAADPTPEKNPFKLGVPFSESCEPKVTLENVSKVLSNRKSS